MDITGEVPENVWKFAKTQGMAHARRYLVSTMPSEMGSLFVDANIALNRQGWRIYEPLEATGPVRVPASPGEVLKGGNRFLFTFQVNARQGPLIVIGPKGRSGPLAVLAFEMVSPRLAEALDCLDWLLPNAMDLVAVSDPAGYTFVARSPQLFSGAWAALPVPEGEAGDLRAIPLDEMVSRWNMRA